MHDIDLENGPVSDVNIPVNWKPTYNVIFDGNKNVCRIYYLLQDILCQKMNDLELYILV